MQDRIIVTRTPLRISFAGGGSDLREFYQKDGPGAVLSAAIDKYVYVTVKRHSTLFNEPIRLNYSETELPQQLNDIRNDIARECLRLLHIDPPIYISTVADVPSGSGLGSSSSFAVGLLHALRTLRGDQVSAGQLAEEACKVEIDILKKPIGKQDQFAAAYGGMNFITFSADEKVSVTPIQKNVEEIKEHFQHLMLFWTGLSRTSESILADQSARTKQRVNREQLVRIRDMALELHDILLDHDGPEMLGKFLDYNWELKRQLSTKISNPEIDDYYRRGKSAGALGGKLCGAGGGGFLMFVVAPARQEQVRAALSNLRLVPIRFETLGTRLLFPNQ